jgi:hypothetical protein
MDRGLIRSIRRLLRETPRPLRSSEIAVLLSRQYSDNSATPAVHKNVPSLLAQEMSKQYPRWRKVGRGLYTANDSVF